MIRQNDNNIWISQSQQTTGQVTMIFPEKNRRQSRPAAVQHVHVNPRNPDRCHNEFDLTDREKQAVTARWVLNVIAAHEAYHKTLKVNPNHHESKKKHSFQSRISSKVEPIESGSSKFTATSFYPYQNPIVVPHGVVASPTSIGDDNGTSLSDFSTTSSIEHDTQRRGRSNNPSYEYSTEDFRENKNRSCITKQMIIGCTVLSIILIIGIIVAVLVTILVGRNQSSSTSGESKSSDLNRANGRSLSTSNSICPEETFNITDSLCQSQQSYQYYSCSQMVTSDSLTIRFTFQHDTSANHWYFDDISAVQDTNQQLIVNGGFESNFTGWMINTSVNSISDIYVDRRTGLAHTGSAYLHITSTNASIYVEQTFNVTRGEYIHFSFWWGYDNELTNGSTCQVTVQLIPSS